MIISQFNVHDWPKCLAQPIADFLFSYSDEERNLGKIWEYSNNFQYCKLFVEENSHFSNYLCVVINTHILENKNVTNQFYIEQYLQVEPINNFKNLLSPTNWDYKSNFIDINNEWITEFSSQTSYVLPCKNANNCFELVSSLIVQENEKFIFNDNFFIFNRKHFCDHSSDNINLFFQILHNL